MVLNQEMLDQFDRNGYIVMENFLSDEEVDLLRNASFQLLEEIDEEEEHSLFSTTKQTEVMLGKQFINSADKVSYFFEEKAKDEQGKLIVDKQHAVNKIGHALHALLPSFKQVTFSDKVKAVVHDLGFKDPVVVQSMCIFKQPRIGGIVTPHQDASYINTEPLKAVGLWIALEDATIENSCLYFLPGSHKDGLHGNYRFQCDHDGKYVIYYSGEKPEYDPTQFVPVPVTRGSMIVIDGLVVHQSAPNLSDKTRLAYTLHLYDHHVAKWNPKNWLQPTASGTFLHMNEVKV